MRRNASRARIDVGPRELVVNDHLCESTGASVSVQRCPQGVVGALPVRDSNYERTQAASSDVVHDCAPNPATQAPSGVVARAESPGDCDPSDRRRRFAKEPGEHNHGPPSARRSARPHAKTFALHFAETHRLVRRQ